MASPKLQTSIQRLTSFAERHCRTFERRSERRFAARNVALIQPLTDDLQPLGEPIVGITRDMSNSGIGLIVESCPAMEQVAVSFTVDDRNVWLLGELRWCDPLGPFDLVGVELVKKLDSVAERWADDLSHAQMLDIFENEPLDFEPGAAENVVITNLGDLKLAATTQTLGELPEDVTVVYDLAQLGDEIYLAAGPEAKLLRWDGDEITTIFERPGQQIFDLLVHDDQLLIGLSGETSELARLDGGRIRGIEGFEARPPEGLEPGSPFGRSVEEMVIYLHTIHAISYQRLSALMLDMFGVSISEGTIANMLAHAKTPVDATVADIAAELCRAEVIVVAGHQHPGQVVMSGDRVHRLPKRGTSRGLGVEGVASQQDMARVPVTRGLGKRPDGLLASLPQAVAHLPVDVADLGCDFYAFSGHKLYGPTWSFRGRVHPRGRAPHPHGETSRRGAGRERSDGTPSCGSSYGWLCTRCQRLDGHRRNRASATVPHAAPKIAHR